MDVLLVTLGATTRSGRAAALEARKQGIKAGVLQVQTVWPFPDKEVAELGRRARMVVVPEMNYSGQMAGEVRKAVGPDMDEASQANTTERSSPPRRSWPVMLGPSGKVERRQACHTQLE